jgi:O-antigen/teichoic acid export membrane protein
MVVVTAGAVLVFVFAPQLLRLLYPDHHAEAVTALRVLCVGTALFAPQSLLSNFYTVQLGRPRISLMLAGLSAGINVAVSAALIPAYGYLGGAWGTTISYAVASVVSFAWFVRLSGLPLSRVLRPGWDDVLAYPRLALSLLRRTGSAPAQGPGDAAEPGRPL